MQTSDLDIGKSSEYPTSRSDVRSFRFVRQLSSPYEFFVRKPTTEAPDP
jgi:hypothetical protein